MPKKPGPAMQPQIMLLNDNKAGMIGLDKKKIDEIIYEASKNSPYFKNQQLKQEHINKKIEALQEKLADCGEITKREAMKQADEMICNLESSRKDMSRIIVHVDMDMFYAAVETLDNRALEKIPMAVGGKSLATSNYHARKYGVRAGMAGFIALKLCPQLRIVAPNFKRYKEKSNEVMKVLETYDPNYSRMGLDECYMDLTEHVKQRFLAGRGKLSGDSKDGYQTLPDDMWILASEVIAEMRNKVKETTGLTCSAGIAHNKMFAKVCSDINKPNNQYMLKSTSLEVVENFLHSTPVRKISGIGPVQQQLLESLGIITCQDLYEKRNLILLLFYPSSIEFYMRVSVGVSSNTVPTEDCQPKSKGSEHTLGAPTDNLESLNDHIDVLSNDVSEDIKSYGLKGRTITLSIKWSTYKRNQRSRTINYYTDDAIIIARTAKDLLAKELSSKRNGENKKIRLVGVRLSTFENEDAGDETYSAANEGKRSIQPKIENYVKRMCPTNEVLTTPEIKSIGENVSVDLHNSEKRERMIEEKIRERFPVTKFPIITAKERQEIIDLVEDELSDGSDCAEEFTCCYCHRDFNTMELLEEHVFNEPDCETSLKAEPTHSILETFACPICSVLEIDLVSLNKHIDICLNKDVVEEVSVSDNIACPSTSYG